MTDGIDKTSLGWVGYMAMHASLGLTEEVALQSWPLNEKHWMHVMKVVEAEVIKRYTATHGQPEETPAFKPRYGNFLEVTRDLCR